MDTISVSSYFLLEILHLLCTGRHRKILRASLCIPDTLNDTKIILARAFNKENHRLLTF